MIRISRPCYDKPHRCPGRAGGGWKYAKAQRCTSGMIEQGGRFWTLRVRRCDECGMFVLPVAIRWTSLTWIKWKAARHWERICMRMAQRHERRIPDYCDCGYLDCDCPCVGCDNHCGAHQWWLDRLMCR